MPASQGQVKENRLNLDAYIANHEESIIQEESSYQAGETNQSYQEQQE